MSYQPTVRWLPTSKAAEAVGCSGATLRRWARAGRIHPPKKITKRLIFWKVPTDEPVSFFAGLMNVTETAKYLGIHRITLTRLVKVCKLPAQEIGYAGIRGWRPEVLNKFFEDLPPN